MPNHKGKDKKEDKNNQMENGKDKEKGNDRQGKGRNGNGGLMDVLEVGDWVLVFTTNDNNPVFGQVQQVNREVLVLENVFVPIEREVTAIIMIDEIEKIFNFGNEELTDEELNEVLNNL